YWLRPPARSVSQEVTGKQDVTSTLSGLKAIVRSPKTGWALLSVFSTALFCGPIVTFSPVIVRDVLHAGVGEFGGVLTAFGVGGILGPLLILTMQRVDPMKMSLTAALVYGLFIVSVSQVNAVWQLAFLLVGSGFLLTVANTSANTFLQSQAND